MLRDGPKAHPPAARIDKTSLHLSQIPGSEFISELARPSIDIHDTYNHARRVMDECVLFYFSFFCLLFLRFVIDD